MTAEWQFFLLWGVLVGAGTGVTAMVLAAVVATRWFDERRGLVMGMLSAANATGQLAFLPLLARVVESSNWRIGGADRRGRRGGGVRIVCLHARSSGRHRTAAVRQRRGCAAAPRRRALRAAWWRSRCAMRTRAFWILAGTFFICGASTNGLIGTHLISACHDVGIPPTRSTPLLAMMGIFDILGTTASGWLTDRYSARHLLFGYYSLRGLSLLFLPATLIDGGVGLGMLRGVHLLRRSWRRYANPSFRAKPGSAAPPPT